MKKQKKGRGRRSAVIAMLLSVTMCVGIFTGYTPVLAAEQITDEAVAETVQSADDMSQDVVTEEQETESNEIEEQVNEDTEDLEASEADEEETSVENEKTDEAAEENIDEFVTEEENVDSETYLGTGSVTRSQAVAWAKARADEAWNVDVDGAYGVQCVDLILAYYEYLGQSRPSGNAINYSWNTLPSGWSRVYSDPQPGDIVVYNKGAAMGGETADSDYGHIGIVVEVGSTLTTVETNTYNYRAARYRYNRLTSAVACYIRPDFASEYLNLGTNFTGLILRTDVWKPIYADSSNNVVLKTEERHARYYWNFQRQSDGSYIIENLYTGTVLDVTGASTENCTPVGVYTQWGDDNGAQKWYFSANGNGYSVIPKLAVDKCMDVAGGESTDGTAIQIYESNSSAAQIFSLYTANVIPESLSIKAEKDSMSVDTSQTVSVTFNNSTTFTGIHWTVSDSSVATLSDSTGTSVELNALKAGTVTLTAISDFSDKITAEKKITITEAVHPEISDDGWYYVDSLPTNLDDSYEVQYKNYYKTTAETSPGTGWVNAGVAKTEWVDSGSAYETYETLATSEFRVLVSRYFFHFCGPNAGAEANYEYTSKFVHFDSVNANDVNISSTGKDGSIDYYLLTWKSNGNNVYCASGTTCDGSSGTHGNRSRAWYSMNKYQDRVKKTTYNYTKESDWTSKKDSSAASVVIRYRQAVSVSAAVSDASVTEGDEVTITADAQGGSGTYTYKFVAVNPSDNAEVTLKDYSSGSEFIWKPDAAGTWKIQVLVKDSLGQNAESGIVTVAVAKKAQEIAFVDVKKSNYYYDAVLWAVNQGITGGRTTTTFAPDEACTRQQVVMFLWSAAGKPEPKTTKNPFTDVKSSGVFYKAIMWAVENGITSGKTAKTFEPNATCTRQQIAMFLWKYKENPAHSVKVNPFTDISQNGTFYNPIMWAVETGITSGKTATTFAPNEECTRAQIVTFLYRMEHAD